jgi:small subunit ribosomal protein S1
VIAVTADSIVLDIGFKTEGVLPLTAFPADKPPKPGDKVQVTIKGRDPEGYYELTRGKVERPPTGRRSKKPSPRSRRSSAP